MRSPYGHLIPERVSVGEMTRPLWIVADWKAVWNGKEIVAFELQGWRTPQGAKEAAIDFDVFSSAWKALRREL